jgi:hypothetical protein
MEKVTSEQKDKVLYAIKWAFKIGAFNEFDGLPQIKERGGEDIYKEKERRKLYASLGENSVALAILVKAGRAAAEALGKGEYTEDVKNLIREFDMIKEQSSVPIHIEDANPIKELVLEDFITCKVCNTPSEFTKDVLKDYNVPKDAKLLCEACGSIIGIFKDKSRLTKYVVQTNRDGVEETLLIQAIDLEHANHKLATLKYLEHEILSVENVSEKKSLDNVADIKDVDFSELDKEPTVKDIQNAEQEIIDNQDEEENNEDPIDDDDDIPDGSYVPEF